MPDRDRDDDADRRGGAEPTRPTRLVLVRHGESTSTVAQVIGGHRTCGGLSPLGVEQARRLRDRLARTREITADRLVASAFARARQTAEIIAPALGDLPVEEDAGFGEQDPGPDCDGLSFDEFRERYGSAPWEHDPYLNGFPGGETVAEFHLRVHTTVSRLLESSPGGTIVVVCHGGVVDAVVRRAVHGQPTGAFELYTRSASLTELEVVGPARWRLHRYNDAAHLEGLPPATANVVG